MQSNQLLGLLVASMLFGDCKSIKAQTNDLLPQPSKLKIEIIDPEALTILDSSAIIEIIGKGFKWTEGPLYIKEGNYLIFSDIPDNKIYKWNEG
jgi:gluconolactonase